MIPPSAHQTSWWSVREFVAPMLTSVGTWPMVGTPEWCALPDDDARKIAAIYDAAQHWALRVESSQAARAEASRDVSAAADWSAIAADVYNHAAFYAARPWLKRRAS